MAMTDDSHFNVGDMKVPTFYSSVGGEMIAYNLFMPLVGVVLGGIHCVGWFFNSPSSDEATLWRVSSTVLTGIAFLLPILFPFVGFLLTILSSHRERLGVIAITVLSMILLLYVVSRLLLLVEAFISLRHLTPGMLALVKS